MTKPELTILEEKALEVLREMTYGDTNFTFDPQNPDEHAWFGSVDDQEARQAFAKVGIMGKSRSGVISSLARKGVIVVRDYGEGSNKVDNFNHSSYYYMSDTTFKASWK